jgi:hypothetical protein
MPLSMPGLVPGFVFVTLLNLIFSYKYRPMAQNRIIIVRDFWLLMFADNLKSGFYTLFLKIIHKP